jgi:Mrp family chromosome partitioning ATPase
VDLWQHLRAVWRYRYGVLAATLVMAVAAYAWSTTLSDVYRAEATLRAVPGSPAEVVGSEQILFLARSYAEQATTRPVLSDAIDLAGLDITTAEAAQRVAVTVTGDTGFLEVVVTGPTPGQASALGAGMAEALASLDGRDDGADGDEDSIDAELEAVEAELGALGEDDPRRAVLQRRYDALIVSLIERDVRPADRLEIVAPAEAGDDPVAPRPLVNAALAFVVGLIVNAELAVVWTLVGGRFSRRGLPEEVGAATGLPVLGRIPTGEGDEVVEAHRALRTNLLYDVTSGDIRSLAVVGGRPGAGTSATARHLAEAFASTGMIVVLVDGDFRTPGLHGAYGEDVSPGLADIDEDVAFVPLLRPVADNLWLMPAGVLSADPGAVAGRSLPRLLDELAPAQLVVIDTPPASLYADAAALAASCDAALVVVDPETTRKTVVSTLGSLERVHVRVVGVVANHVAVARRRLRAPASVLPEPAPPAAPAPAGPHTQHDPAPGHGDDGSRDEVVPEPPPPAPVGHEDDGVDREPEPVAVTPEVADDADDPWEAGDGEPDVPATERDPGFVEGTADGAHVDDAGSSGEEHVEVGPDHGEDQADPAHAALPAEEPARGAGGGRWRPAVDESDQEWFRRSVAARRQL